MSELHAFKAGLEAYLTDPHARPFVCTGSPFRCRSFVVGFNAATRLKDPFSSYWSDSTGFDRAKFDVDYAETRPRRGNRPRIEIIADAIAPCLETNLHAIPTRKARQLSKEDQRDPVIGYLFQAIKPELVFVHGNEPIRFFEVATGCSGFASEVKRARWHGHEFWLFGRPGPLYRWGFEDARACGAHLATYLVE